MLLTKPIAAGPAATKQACPAPLSPRLPAIPCPPARAGLPPHAPRGTHSGTCKLAAPCAVYAPQCGRVASPTHSRWNAWRRGAGVPIACAGVPVYRAVRRDALRALCGERRLDGREVHRRLVGGRLERAVDAAGAAVPRRDRQDDRSRQVASDGVHARTHARVLRTGASFRRARSATCQRGRVSGFQTSSKW